jgi:hypothetical protein
LLVNGNGKENNGLDCLTLPSNPIDALTQIPALTNYDERRATENAPLIAPAIDITPHHSVVDALRALHRGLKPRRCTGASSDHRDFQLSNDPLAIRAIRAVCCQKS